MAGAAMRKRKMGPDMERKVTVPGRRVHRKPDSFVVNAGSLPDGRPVGKSSSIASLLVDQEVCAMD